MTFGSSVLPFGAAARGAVAFALTFSFVAAGASAQSSRMPSTLRYGSGLIDVPAASVLPHLAVTGTYSGFGLSVSDRLVVNRAGEVITTDGPFEKWLADASIAVGLFDMAEMGVTIQHYDDTDEGGNLLGAFARLSVLPSSVQGLDLAVGARYVTSPNFDPATDEEYRPNRLGYPDARIWSEEGREFSSNLTPYAVATAHFPGVEASFLPKHDFSFTVGWGGGLFSAGSNLDLYGDAESDGVFAGSVIHVGLGDERLLNVTAEFNGFDVNAGVQLDMGGIRVGAFALGLNYNDHSTFRSRKLGVLASVAFCGAVGGLCKPRLVERPGPDTVTLPPPPPDTVVMERTVAPPLPTGASATICLATGVPAQVMVTAQGDTLVGPSRVSISELRPVVDFAGNYAQGKQWFEDDEPLEFEEREYSKSGEPLRLNCADIERVGEHEGVPLFADRSQERPLDMVYVPVTPGVWQGYEHGLQRTRGE